jgi:hypothetical protein
MGLVVVALTAPINGYDALPDPAGWVLVLLGVRGLPADLERRGVLVALAALALAVSLPLWLPEVAEELADAHPSLGWAVSLPQLFFAALLCAVLGRRAAEHADRRAAGWAGTAATGFVLAAAFPVLVFGAGVDALENPTLAVAVLSLLLLIGLLFGWAGRPWIEASPREVDWTGA